MAYWNGPQASARDLYPNIDGYTTAERTNPETEEMDHYTSGPASANVETPDGIVIPARRSDVLGFVGFIVVAALVLYLVGKA
jgi:hypothetical protein